MYAKKGVFRAGERRIVKGERFYYVGMMMMNFGCRMSDFGFSEIGVIAIILLAMNHEPSTMNSPTSASN